MLVRVLWRKGVFFCVEIRIISVNEFVRMAWGCPLTFWTKDSLKPTVMHHMPACSKVLATHPPCRMSLKTWKNFG